MYFIHIGEDLKSNCDIQSGYLMVSAVDKNKFELGQQQPTSGFNGVNVVKLIQNKTENKHYKYVRQNRIKQRCKQWRAASRNHTK